MLVNLLQEKLTPFVGALRKSAAEGSESAKQVINLYNMYTRCPEEGAKTLCECYFEDWKKEENIP
jgi:hypothetical protein